MGKRFPLRLDELPRERLGDHRDPKWRESMTVTTNGRLAVGGKADRPAWANPGARRRLRIAD
jgi:hypothetical protein